MQHNFEMQQSSRGRGSSSSAAAAGGPQRAGFPGREMSSLVNRGSSNDVPLATEELPPGAATARGPSTFACSGKGGREMQRGTYIDAAAWEGESLAAADFPSAAARLAGGAAVQPAAAGGAIPAAAGGAIPAAAGAAIPAAARAASCLLLQSAAAGAAQAAAAEGCAATESAAADSYDPADVVYLGTSMSSSSTYPSTCSSSYPCSSSSNNRNLPGSRSFNESNHQSWQAAAADQTPDDGVPETQSSSSSTPNGNSRVLSDHRQSVSSSNSDAGFSNSTTGGRQARNHSSSNSTRSSSTNGGSISSNTSVNHSSSRSAAFGNRSSDDSANSSRKRSSSSYISDSMDNSQDSSPRRSSGFYACENCTESSEGTETTAGVGEAASRMHSAPPCDYLDMGSTTSVSDLLLRQPQHPQHPGFLRAARVGSSSRGSGDSSNGTGCTIGSTTGGGVKSSSKNSSSRTEEESLQGSEEQSVSSRESNDSLCFSCSGGGELLCCEGCPKAYHVECVAAAGHLLPRAMEEDWFCPDCLASASAARGRSTSSSSCSPGTDGNGFHSSSTPPAGSSNSITRGSYSGGSTYSSRSCSSHTTAQADNSERAVPALHVRPLRLAQQNHPTCMQLLSEAKGPVVAQGRDNGTPRCRADQVLGAAAGANTAAGSEFSGEGDAMAAAAGGEHPAAIAPDSHHTRASQEEQAAAARGEGAFSGRERAHSAAAGRGAATGGGRRGEDDAVSCPEAAAGAAPAACRLGGRAPAAVEQRQRELRSSPEAAAYSAATSAVAAAAAGVASFCQVVASSGVQQQEIGSTAGDAGGRVACGAGGTAFGRVAEGEADAAPAASTRAAEPAVSDAAAEDDTEGTLSCASSSALHEAFGCSPATSSLSQETLQLHPEEDALQLVAPQEPQQREEKQQQKQGQQEAKQQQQEAKQEKGEEEEEVEGKQREKEGQEEKHVQPQLQQQQPHVAAPARRGEKVVAASVPASSTPSTGILLGKTARGGADSRLISGAPGAPAAAAAAAAAPLVPPPPPGGGGAAATGNRRGTAAIAVVARQVATAPGGGSNSSSSSSCALSDGATGFTAAAGGGATVESSLQLPAGESSAAAAGGPCLSSARKRRRRGEEQRINVGPDYQVPQLPQFYLLRTYEAERLMLSAASGNAVGCFPCAAALGSPPACSAFLDPLTEAAFGCVHPGGRAAAASAAGAAGWSLSSCSSALPYPSSSSPPLSYEWDFAPTHFPGFRGTSYSERNTSFFNCWEDGLRPLLFQQTHADGDVRHPPLEPRLVYSPHCMETRRQLCAAAAAARGNNNSSSDGSNGQSGSSRADSFRCVSTHHDLAKFVEDCAKKWKAQPGWQPYSPEFAYKLLHRADYDPQRALNMLDDPGFSFIDMCDPPMRKYENKWKRRDKRGTYPPSPYPPPVVIRAYLQERVRSMRSR